MTSKRVLEIEVELLDECMDYIFSSRPEKDETMEACVKAFSAVRDYRRALKKKESAGRAPRADKK